MSVLILALFLFLSIAGALMVARKFSFFCALIGLCWLFFVGTGVLPNGLLDRLQVDPRVDVPGWKEKNLIIVLGGGVYRWNSDTWTSSSFIKSRLLETARLYVSCRKVSANCVILASGGKGQRPIEAEADIIKQELMGIGVAESDIWVEQKSRNTFENAKFSKELIGSRLFDRIYLVTSGVHMPRSLLFFRYFSIPASPAPSDRLIAPWRVPASYNFMLMDTALHECLGILKFYFYNLMGWNSAS